nr:piggyBac transposable element-derived protein 3-like [Hydra vulgaris]
MIAFKERSLIKQYLLKKPTKWGFKLWGRSGFSGFLYDFDVYQGKEMESSKASTYGVGASVVLNMLSSLPSGHNFKVFADNFFTSLTLLDVLKERAIWFVGAIRTNRLNMCPLLCEKDLRKEGRGSYDYRTDTYFNLILVRWYDNKAVTLYMGGIDQLDMMCSFYKANLKYHCWYIYTWAHTIVISLVNAWFLYRRDLKLIKPKAKHMPIKKFQAEVATSLIKAEKCKFGRPSLETMISPKAKRSVVQGNPTQDVRQDGVNHLPAYTKKRQRCKKCPAGFSYIQCQKCNVWLCMQRERNCFKDFHV